MAQLDRASDCGSEGRVFESPWARHTLLFDYTGDFMKVGIVSDTHGNVKDLKRVYQFLNEEHKINKFIHLGHDFSDVDKAQLDSINENSGDETVSSEDSTFFSDLASVLVGKQEENPLLKKISKIYQVPGEGDSKYGSPLFPAVKYVSIGGIIFVLVHDIKKLKQEDLINGSVILHGETHVAQAEMLAGRVFVNPGHMSRENIYGATFALLQIEYGNKIKVLHFDMQYRIVDNKNFTLKTERKFGAS